MTIYKPPHEISATDLNKFKIFLAGSIEMDTATDWQQKITEILSNFDMVILNPRRDDWDSSWKQSINDKNFRGQVEWELDNLDSADVILMYFDPKTKSPISLLELGLYANDDKLIVYCPEGFWRKGNVDIVCHKYNIDSCMSWDEVIEKIARKYKSFLNK